jgi:hypothetical protein
MATFGIIIENTPVVERYMADVKDRLEDSNMLRNPFKGYCLSFDIKNAGQNGLLRGYATKVQPLYPNFTPYGFLASLGIYIVWGMNIWIIPGIFIGILGVFWSKYFYYYIYKLGLKKVGYTGYMKLLSAEEVMDRWCEWDR